MQKDLVEENRKINKEDDEWFQKGCRDVTIERLAIKEYCDLIAKEGETVEQVLDLTPAEQLERLKLIRLSLENHEQTVKQNQDLQAELRNLNKKPFFSYPLNSGNMADYGAFYLVSHAWFSFLNTPQQIGVIEVQYKTDNRRVIYIGISQGDPTPEGFNKSVLNIAKYGQKMKDSLDVV